MKSATVPLLIAAGLAAYVLIAGKLGTCPACVAITDAIFGPEAEASLPADGSWSFADLEGGALHAGDLDGSVSVVTFWATWCPPCRKEIPVLNEIHEQYSERGVKVIGVSVDEGPDASLRTKVNELGIQYPVVRGAEDIPGLFGEVRSIPTVVILTPDQDVAFRHVGYLPREELEKELEKLL